MSPDAPAPGATADLSGPPARTPATGTTAATSRPLPLASPSGPTASTPTSPGLAAGPPSAPPVPEWAVQALDKVDEIVAKVRANTTERLVRIARIVVFGLLAAIMGGTAGVLAVIGLVRGLDELLPGPVWAVYLLLGAIFTAVGAFLWARKAPRPTNA